MKEDIDRFWRVSEQLDEASRQECLVEWSESSTRDLEAQEAAFRLAVAVGRCRLFGIEPAEESLRGELLWSMGDAALRAASRAAGRLWRELQLIEDMLLDCDTAPERHTLATGILEDRLDLEGARLAFHASQEEGIRAAGAAPPLWHQRLELYAAQLSDLDATIRSNQESLSAVAETYWPANVATCLASEIWLPRPWWLTSECTRLYQENRALIAELHRAGESLAVYLYLEECLWSRLDDRRMENDCDPSVELAGGEEPDASAQAHELAMAADAGAALERVPVRTAAARFVQRDQREDARLELLINTDWVSVNPRRLPPQLAAVVQFTCRCPGRFGGLTDSPTTWRMRLGPIVKDLELRRSGGFLLGSAKVSALELGHLPRMVVGQRVALRRVG